MKKCRVCKKEFEPTFNSTQVVCSVTCSIEAAKQKKKKEYSQETRRMKKALQDNDRSYQLKKAQEIFNKYIRERDSGHPCVSCDKPDNGKHQRHASHLRSVGACGALRFNTFNVHTSCAQCNNIKSGNIAEYIPRLRERIGFDKVEWLLNFNETRRYDIAYLKRLRVIFKRKIEILKRNKDD